MLTSCRAMARRKKTPALIHRVQQALKRIDKRRPSRAGARQLFLKSLVARTMRHVGRDPTARREAARHCVAQHGALFKRAPLRERRAYEARARRRVVDTTRQICEARIRLRRERMRLEAEAAHQQRHAHVPNHLAHVGLTEAELHAAVAFYNSNKGVARLDAHVGAWGCVPKPPAERSMPSCWKQAKQWLWTIVWRRLGGRA